MQNKLCWKNNTTLSDKLLLLNDKHITAEQIIYLPYDELIDCNIKENVEIYLKKQYNTSIKLLNKEIFLLIDESQYDKNWSMSSKNIYDRP